jgi:hypothetical protein
VFFTVRFVTVTSVTHKPSLAPASAALVVPSVVPDLRVKYMLELEHIGVISDEMREVVQSEWPELAHKLPPKKSQ